MASPGGCDRIPIENGWIGLAGLILFFGCFSYAFWKRLRLLAEEDRDFLLAVYCGWLSIALAFFFFDGFYWLGPNMTFWCLLGICFTGLKERPVQAREGHPGSAGELMVEAGRPVPER
jgi:hypothetical protein